MNIQELAKKLRKETGIGFIDSLKTIQRFNGDYTFAVTFVKYAKQAVSVTGDRYKRDYDRAVQELGRKHIEIKQGEGEQR